MLKALSPRARLTPRAGETTRFNARPIGSALFQSVVYVVVAASCLRRTEPSGQPILQRYALTLICPTSLAPLALRELRRDGLCVLARTIQFSKNRPTGRPRDARIPRPKLDQPSGRPRLGEPSKVTRNYSPCQLFSSPDTRARSPQARGDISSTQSSGEWVVRSFLKYLLEAKPEAEFRGPNVRKVSRTKTTASTSAQSPTRSG